VRGQVRMTDTGIHRVKRVKQTILSVQFDAVKTNGISLPIAVKQ